MGWGLNLKELVRILVKQPCKGYYLRWYYNGWHYWYFLPGRYSIVTEGEKYRTVGTRRISMSSGQIIRSQCDAIRTIMNTREVYLLTVAGWMNIRIEPGTLTIYDNQLAGAEIELTAIIGSKEISYITGYTPAPGSAELPLPSSPDMIYITHHATVFIMVLTGHGNITVCWGDGICEDYVLTDNPLTITHTYTDGIPEHTITIDGEENIVTMDVSGNHITEIIIPPTTTSLITLIADDNELTDVIIPPEVPLLVLTLTNNPLTVCEIVINTQIWMCKNYASRYPASKVYDDGEDNRAIYGGLYTRSQVVANGFCPPMWHVPTLAEWQSLINYLGGDLLAGGHLKESGITHWDGPNTGADNSSGFKALGAGMFSTVFAFLYQYAKFWTADRAVGISVGFSIELSHTSAEAQTLSTLMPYYLSVRLLKNFIYQAPFRGTTTDIDGNVYHYLTIGTQQWMLENLKTTHYADGTDIPNISGYSDWFLPSKDALDAMYVNLHLFGIGGFATGLNVYWTSSEFNFNSAWVQEFATGTQFTNFKGLGDYVRAIRSFVSTDIYSLRDVGPAGGWIFHIIDLGGGSYEYYEAASSDQSIAHDWSNVLVALGTTDTTVAESQNNTNEIIAQAGHVDSAAKLCDDLTSADLWVTDVNGAYCWYNNDIAYKTPYGALYNFPAVINAHGLPPATWRVPSQADFNILIAYCGGLLVAGGVLKEVGLVHWNAPNLGAVDTYGFCGVPNGVRNLMGVFALMGTNGFFFTSTPDSPLTVVDKMLDTNTTIFSEASASKICGMAVRCMRYV